MEGLLAYLAAWFLFTTIAYILGLGRDSKLSISPLAVVVRTGVVFKLFDRFTGSRVIGLLLDGGIAASYLSLALFYATIGAGFLTAARTGRPTGMLTPILPGATIEVTTFLYMLPGLSAAIILHEAFHALAARHAGIPVKSSGFLVILGVLPAAFVEPDEEGVRKAPRRARLRLYAAGVLANIVLYALFSAALAAASTSGMYTVIVSVEPGSAAYNASLKPYTVVEYFVINGTKAYGASGLAKILSEIRSSNGGTLSNITLVVTLVTPEGNVTIMKPAAPKQARNTTRYEMIGIRLYDAPKGLVDLLGASAGIKATLVLLYASMINISLAMINAAPLFITDGFHILRDTVAAFTEEQKAEAIARAASVVTLAMILPNLRL